MRIISNEIDGLETLKTAKSYIGKRVVSKAGRNVGRINDIVFVKGNLRGVVIGDLFIDREFFDTLGDSLMLSINPATKVLGKQVFDADGRKIGKIIDIKLKGNDLISISARRSVFYKPNKIDAKEIAVMKDNVILKKSYDNK